MKKVISFLIIVSCLGMGLKIIISNSYYNDDVYLKIDGSGMNEDGKLFLLVDVPSTGGKAIRYAMYEVISNSNDNWYFYEDSSSNTNPVYLYLNWYDYVIIVTSDSSSNGDMDDFSLTMQVDDSGESDFTYKTYNFGDSSGTDLYIGIWQLEDKGYLEFAHNGKPVIQWEDDDTEPTEN